MDVRHDCLCCGRGFTGRPNRTYCSVTCKNREKNHRRRIQAVSVALSHAGRQRELARLNGNTTGLRFHSWRQRQLQAELDTLINAGHKQAQKVV